MLRCIMILLMVCQPILGKGGWILTYGRDEVDGSNSVLQRPDGGYILMGYTRSFGNGGHDIWLISTGPDGKKEWAEFYGAAGQMWDTPLSVRRTAAISFLARHTPMGLGSVISC